MSPPYFIKGIYKCLKTHDEYFMLIGRRRKDITLIKNILLSTCLQKGLSSIVHSLLSHLNG